MLGIVPPLALGARAYGSYTKALTAKVQTELSSAAALADDRLSHMALVRWFSRENTEMLAYQVSSKRRKVLDSGQWWC